MVESQGQKRQDTVFVLSCQHIQELYPWLAIPQDIADQDREDCRYTQQFDMLLEQKLNWTCNEREYLAGIARLADTRIQLECCRMRTRTETGCVHHEYDKPLGSGARTEIEYQAKLINAISIEGNIIRVRFCDLSPRPIDDIFDDLAKTTTRRTTTAPPSTLGWWQTTRFAINSWPATTKVQWPTNYEEIAAHPILNHPKLRKKYHWPSDNVQPNTIGQAPVPIPTQTPPPTLAPPIPSTLQIQHQTIGQHSSSSEDEYEDELLIPEEILHVDEIGTPQRTFRPSPVKVAQTQHNGGVPQQVISVQPLPLTPLQWKFGQNVTQTEDKQWEGTGDPFHRRQAVSATPPQQGPQAHGHAVAAQQQQQYKPNHRNSDHDVPAKLRDHPENRDQFVPATTQQQAVPATQQQAVAATQQQAVPATQQQAQQQAVAATQQQAGVATQQQALPATQQQAVPATQQQAGAATQQQAVHATQQQAGAATQQVHDHGVFERQAKKLQNDTPAAVQQVLQDHVQVVPVQQQPIQEQYQKQRAQVESEKSHQAQAVSTIQKQQTQQQQKASQPVIVKPLQTQQQSQPNQPMEQENMDDPFHRGQAALETQPQKLQKTTSTQTDQTNTSTIHEQQQQSLGQRSTSGEQQKYKLTKDNDDVLRSQKLQNSSYVDQQDKMRSDLNQEKNSSQNDQHAEADKQVAEQQQLKLVHHQAVKQQTTANQVQEVQQQPNQQQQQQSATVEVKPVVLADAQEQKDVLQNGRQLQLKHVQAVPQQNVEEHFNKSSTKTMTTQEIPHQNEDGAASQQQHNQNDLSFHVVKGFSTRGTKLSFPRSSLLIRRKGLRELTVTLLPPKVGQPIGPRISADRERQMTEIAIQERVDAIRKIEKGIQVDTNTEAPLPNWVIPLMSKANVSKPNDENISNIQPQNVTGFEDKQQTQAVHQHAADEKHRGEELQTVSEHLAHDMHQQQQDHQPEVGQVLDKNFKSEEQHSQQEKLQAKRTQTVQQPSVDEQKTSNQIYESKRSDDTNDSMHQILFGEPPQTAVVQQQPKNNTTGRNQAFNIVHSLLWPSQMSEDEISETLSKKQAQAVQLRQNYSHSQNEVHTIELLRMQQQEHANNTGKTKNASQHNEAVPEEQHESAQKANDDLVVQNVNTLKEHQLQPMQGNKSQHDGAVSVEQQVEEAVRKHHVKQQNDTEQRSQPEQQNQTFQEVPDQANQLQLVMSMKGVIRKPLRRLNIQTIQNATEIQTSLNQNVASVAANASSSIDEVPAVANGVKIFNKDKTQNRNVETMFPMTEENESDVPENKKSQENKDKNNREFAASMINAIERHVAETMSGININPDRQDKIINGDSNTFGQPIENEKLLKQPKREQNDLKQNGLLTIDNSTVFTKLPNASNIGTVEEKNNQNSNNKQAEKDEDNSDDSESVERYANKSENNKNSNDDNEDESKMLEKRNALRQSPIGGSRKLILLKDDVGETPKRRKNGKKRRGQKKHQKTGTPIQQLVTTEDIFGTGDVNLPKIEQVEPANEQEEAIVDEELPPSQSELPPFDAFPSPPPSNQRRNSQIGTQLAQLPDYGRALNMNSIKNVTTKTTTLKPPPPLTTTTSTMASVPNEADDHTEIISGERESTTTMEVPKPTTPSKVPRRRQFEKVVPVPREQQQQQLVPPRRVFPSRHGQTTATPAAAAGPINGGLPDEETDSSPFDAERAQFLEHTWHSKQEPTTTNSRRQNRVERIESRFEAKSPFEKEIRRKPIIDVSFPKQQSSDDEENNSNEKLDDGEKAPKDTEIIQKDGLLIYSPPYNQPMPMPMPVQKESDIMPKIGERNDLKTEEKEVEQSLVLMGDDNFVAKTISEEELKVVSIENQSPISTSTSSSSTFESSTIQIILPSQKAFQRRQRVRTNRRRNSTTTTTTTTPTTTLTTPTTTPTTPVPQQLSTEVEEFWAPTRSTVALDTVTSARHVTPYDIAHFYRMPSGSSRHRESVLTFCSKRAAIRDSANMVIACAGEDGQVWTPLRCPPGTDCLPAADSTFQICCPVAIGRRR
ncbi:hypothetical protein GPALN_014882 [Globodera pallida]|nr:hypothetical protein GPALN_014882 [Globodera pallida]